MNTENRLTALEIATADHEKRLEALEARLDPKTREQIFSAAMDDLLDELAGRNRKED